MLNDEIARAIKASLKVSIIHKDSTQIYYKIETPSGTAFSARLSVPDLLPVGREIPGEKVHKRIS